MIKFTMRNINSGGEGDYFEVIKSEVKKSPLLRGGMGIFDYILST